jgi:glycosyltransferase involved in cell wall biosynthesis
VTNLYPGPKRPTFGVFVAVRVAALRRAGASVDVVAIRDVEPHRSLARKYLRLSAATLRHSLSALLRRSRFDVVEAHIAFPTGLIAWPAAVLHRAPLVLFVHGADVAVVAGRSAMHRRLFRFLVDRSAAVIVNSEFMRQETERALGRPEPRVKVVSPGIDLDLFEQPAGAARQGILFVGRLDPEKGATDLLGAIEILRRNGLTEPVRIIGSGTDEAMLRQRAVERNLAIDFSGPLPAEAVATAMQRCRVLVVPSTREALGLVALEGMAAGAIVVATRVGGLVDTVVEGRTGITAKPADPADLAAAIRRALALDAEQEARARVTGSARATAAAHAVDLVVGTTVDLYRTLGSRPRRT